MNGMNGQVSFSLDQLNEALYHAVDITDRCLLPFMLLGETARSIKQDWTLSGDGIYLGTRKGNVTFEVGSTLRTLASGVDINLGIKDFKEDAEGFSWVYRGVPISIKIIHRNYEFMKQPDFVWYMAEQYNVPNPFDKYYKARYLVR